MASGICVGYSDQVLRDVFGIPGWGVRYVVGLAVIAGLASLFPLSLVNDRWKPLRPRTLAQPTWTASAVLVVGALWQIVVAFAVESQTHLASGPAQTVQALAFAPLLALLPLMTAVAWSHAKRHRVPAHM
ncbi:hypothetical protein ACIQXD_34615 [Streptomyces uncialis]|uniref:hypothetical protein n=1 Tax=Streptomyces uncialis TaxID=1048205 RepID=UPI00380F26F7